MIKISILKESQVTNSAQFPTLEEAQEWLSRHEGMGTFGAKAQLIPAVIDENGTELVPATYIDGYKVLIEDLTAKLEQDAQNKAALQFLADTDFKILRHVGQQALGLATSLTAQEYFELEQQRQQAREAIIKGK